jgi:hypothetical protein
MEIKKRDQLTHFPSHMTSANPNVAELKGGLFSKNREKESVGSVTRVREMGLRAVLLLLALMATLASRLNDDIFSLAKVLESGEASMGGKSALGGTGTRLRGWARVKITIISC